MRRLVVTGTGRCGTRYASHVLRAAGVTAGHEKVFTYRVATGRRSAEWSGFAADSSWMAVPYLPDLDVRAVLLVRRPLDVVHSMLKLGWFADGRRLTISQVVDRHRPEVAAERTRADKCLALWTLWNMAALPHVSGVVRFEDLVADPAALLGPAGITGRPSPEALAEIAADPVRRNSKDDVKTPTAAPTWGDFRPALAEAALRTAVSFGYQEDAL